MVSEFSLLMEYFRLFSSICNKRQEGSLPSQTPGEILSLSGKHPISCILDPHVHAEKDKPLFRPHPSPIHSQGELC